MALSMVGRELRFVLGTLLTVIAACLVLAVLAQAL